MGEPDGPADCAGTFCHVNEAAGLMKTFRVQARVAAFVGAIALLIQISQAQAQTYSYAFQFGGFGAGDGQLYGPIGVATASSGNIIVTEYYNHRVQVFDSQGTFLLKFGSYGSGGVGHFYRPVGVAVDATGNIYVADSYNDLIQVFAPDGGLSTLRRQRVPESASLLLLGTEIGALSLAEIRYAPHP
jgi:DNA-binding beta-propeller fold protein YncE